jgi:hypothetical protein
MAPRNIGKLYEIVAAGGLYFEDACLRACS